MEGFLLLFFTLLIAVFLVYGMKKWFERDIIKQCPNCNNAGVLEKVSERLLNKRRQSERIFRSEGGRSRNVNVYTTREYWEKTYKCSTCGHQFKQKYTTSYRS